MDFTISPKIEDYRARIARFRIIPATVRRTRQGAYVSGQWPAEWITHIDDISDPKKTTIYQYLYSYKK